MLVQPAPLSTGGDDAVEPVAWESGKGVLLGVEVHYVGSVGHGVQWDTVTEYHVVPGTSTNVSLYHTLN